MVGAHRIYRTACWFVSGITLSLLSACSDSTDEQPIAAEPVVINTAKPTSSGSASAQPIVLNDNQTPATPNNPDSSQTDIFTGLPEDPAGIAASNTELARLLLTGFEIENQQVVPTTGWICTDVFDQKRVYYFYPEGLLTDSRAVAVERTLNQSDTFEDITFFWAATGSDSVILSSAMTDTNGSLLSSGKQYDINTIRFSEVEDVVTFSAQSLLRGKLVCAAFDLR